MKLKLIRVRTIDNNERKTKKISRVSSNNFVKKIAVGGENSDMGPEMDIQAITKRDDEIQKGLQDGTLDDSIYRNVTQYHVFIVVIDKKIHF